MKTYKLAPNVTAEMLIEEGFEPDWNWSENGRYIYYIDDTEEDNIIANVKTREVVTHACGWIGETLATKIEKKLKDLISKGYVIEND